MKHIIITTVIFLILLSSCARVHYINIDIRQNAPILFAPGTKKVIIADNSFILSGTDSVFEINNRSFITKNVLDSTRLILINSMARYMNEEQYFDTVEVYPYHPKPIYLYKEVTDQVELPLTVDEVIDICTQTESDALISLDLLKISISDKGWETFSTKIEATLRPYSYDGTLLGMPITIEKQIQSSTQKEEEALYPQLIENSQWIADMLIDSFIPKWETQGRVYHTEYPNPSELEVKFMDANKWRNAAILWEEKFHKEKQWKKKVKYASNVALSYENIDDVESALKWINLAYEQLPPKNKSELAKQIEYYKAILTIRFKEKALRESKFKTNK